MPDREYVIRCLKYLHDRETWKEGPLVSDDHAADRRRITADALVLLRKQEPVEPHVEHDSDDDSWYYGCGACHEAIDYKDRFCRHCGREVKWVETD